MSDENLDPTTIIILDRISQYCTPIILCSCLLGNSLSVYVLFCTKLRYNSSSIYLGALAMSDIGVLLMVFLNWFQQYKITENIYELDIIRLGLQMLFCFLSVWIIVAFTIQRYVAIKWPLFRRSLCTVSRARIVVIGLTGLAVLYSIPWFILIIYAEKNNDDDRDRGDLIYIINLHSNFIIIFVLPGTMIVIFNALIVHTICKQNRIRRNLILSFVAFNDKTRSSDSETSHIKVTKMLVIISSIFICLNLPLQVCTLCMFYQILNMYIDIIAYISTYLYIINYGINFILYSATGKNFRKELIRLFTKCSDTANDDMEMKNYEKQSD